jgi:hypothetical protein
VSAAIPPPLRDTYPADGSAVYEYETPGYSVTAHPDGTMRVWLTGGIMLPKYLLPEGEREPPYYPIQAVGMTKDELERAVALAKQLLTLPTNRKARRTRAKRVVN